MIALVGPRPPRGSFKDGHKRSEPVTDVIRGRRHKPRNADGLQKLKKGKQTLCKPS
jgi:hypothetical protein